MEFFKAVEGSLYEAWRAVQSTNPDPNAQATEYAEACTAEQLVAALRACDPEMSTQHAQRVAEAAFPAGATASTVTVCVCTVFMRCVMHCCGFTSTRHQVVMRNLRQGVVQRGGKKGGRGKRPVVQAAAPGQAAKAPAGRVKASYAAQRALEAVRRRWMGEHDEAPQGVPDVEGDSSKEEGG